jgi:NitT/TauT family transport system ATP-binding protein
MSLVGLEPRPTGAPSGDHGASVVHIENLRKSFRLGSKRLLVLDGLTLSVLEGETVGVVGPSGCGKTTLLRIIAGLEEMDEGEVFVFRRDPKDAHGTGVASLIFQRPVLLPWRTVRGNLRLVFDVARKQATTDQQVELMADVISLMSLKGFEEYYPNQLSGGMQARVALARAWISSPKLLLLDEPFGSIDSLTRRSLNLELLKLVFSRAITSLLVTHALEEAACLCDRVVVLQQRPARTATILSNPVDRRDRLEKPFSNCVHEFAEQIFRAVSLTH